MRKLLCVIKVLKSYKSGAKLRVKPILALTIIIIIGSGIVCCVQGDTKN